jgi:hypothetical protein
MNIHYKLSLCIDFLLGFTGVDFSDQSLEGGDGNVLDERVELFSAFSIFVSSSGNSDSDSSGKISDTLAPDELVKSLVNSNILKR